MLLLLLVIFQWRTSFWPTSKRVCVVFYCNTDGEIEWNFCQAVKLSQHLPTSLPKALCFSVLVFFYFHMDSLDQFTGVCTFWQLRNQMNLSSSCLRLLWFTFGHIWQIWSIHIWELTLPESHPFQNLDQLLVSCFLYLDMQCPRLIYVRQIKFEDGQKMWPVAYRYIFS